MKYLLFLLFSLHFALSACKKDHSVADLLIANNWHIKTWTISPAYLGITNWYAEFLLACDQDDITSFESNGVATIDEGAIKCNASDPQSTTGTWSLNEAETEFTFSYDGHTNVWTIVELTENALILENSFQEDVLGNGTLTTFTFTLTLEII